MFYKFENMQSLMVLISENRRIYHLGTAHHSLRSFAVLKYQL